MLIKIQYFGREYDTDVMEVHSIEIRDANLILNEKTIPLGYVDQIGGIAQIDLIDHGQIINLLNRWTG